MGLTHAETFTAFVRTHGARIQHALMATLGSDAGSDAAAEALAHAWMNWDKVMAMENPAGYVYTVGRNKGRRMVKRPVFRLPSPPVDSSPWVEPGLPAALAELSERQRVATLLVYGGGWTLTEVGELLGVDRGTVKKHVDRGLSKLRTALEVQIIA